MQLEAAPPLAKPDVDSSPSQHFATCDTLKQRTQLSHVLAPEHDVVRNGCFKPPNLGIIYYMAKVASRHPLRLISKETTACQCRRPGFHPWTGMIPWRRVWLPTPVFLPGGLQSIGSQRVRHELQQNEKNR